MTIRKLHPHSRRGKRLGHFARRVLTVLLLLVIGYGLIRLGLAGRTSSWPLADCTAVASRVVPGGIFTSTLFRRPLIYIGEFQLRYMVEGREYLLWAHSGWYDADQNFIQQRVAALPATCPNRIRFNP